MGFRKQAVKCFRFLLTNEVLSVVLVKCGIRERWIQLACLDKPQGAELCCVIIPKLQYNSVD